MSMYYPYLRGRQNELLCLRELLNKNELSKKIIPVIEPVRFNSTFFSTLSAFLEKKRRVIIIQNPSVGSFESDRKKMELKIETEIDSEKKLKMITTLEAYYNILADPEVDKAFIVNKTIVNEVLSGSLDINGSVLINQDNEYIDDFEDNPGRFESSLCFIPKDEDFLDAIEGNKVLLEDGFKKRKRNVEYINNPDESFSKNHKVYKNWACQGFSDYSIVGDNYEEEGFAPMAVAIHIVYFDDKHRLRVHHFVSESNDNISDPARKFEEAMKNLLDWEKYKVVASTGGLKKLVDCYKNGKFPGLGMVKRYSLMHHLQMMGEYLEMQDDLL